MNHQCILTSRPTGVAQADNFEIIETDSLPLEKGQIRVSNNFLSVEPAMRGWIADADNYSEPVPVGSVMRALAVGEVIESRTVEYAVGDIVAGWFGWQTEAVVDPGAVVRRVEEHDLPQSLALGILGINGVTAHLAFTTIGKPQPGETVLVSTAAGAVGSAVGQIAKILGCRTVGITGGPEKVEQCKSLFGYDAAIDYRAPGLSEAIADACPAGVDVYYDNTAGAISDAVYPQLALKARIVVCGTASISSWDPWPTGPRLERHLLVKRASMKGFVIFDHMDRYQDSVTTLAGWIRDGKIGYQEDILDGIDACPDALAGLYRGDNKGKRVIRL